MTKVLNVPKPSASGSSFLRSDGTCITYSKLSTNDIEVSESFKKEIAELVKKEIGKVFLEMFLNGDLPLTDSAKKYFVDKI